MVFLLLQLSIAPQENTPLPDWTVVSDPYMMRPLRINRANFFSSRLGSVWSSKNAPYGLCSLFREGAMSTTELSIRILFREQSMSTS